VDGGEIVPQVMSKSLAVALSCMFVMC